jgi:GT2 family glycosyltransferase
MQRPFVSIVMVAFGGGWAWLDRALEALRLHTPLPFEVIVVDNGGAEDRNVEAHEDVEIVRNDRNVGFGPGSNQGAERARGKLLCMLNTDAFVRPGWLEPLQARLEDERIGAVVPTKWNLDRTLQEAGAFVTGDGYAHVFASEDVPDRSPVDFRREIDFGSAACLAITRQRFESLGGFDPAYRLAYYEDADLCFRLRERGFLVVLEPDSHVIHARTVSGGSELLDISAANRDVFLARWGSELAHRPVLAELEASARHRLQARDFHAHDRLLFLEGDGTSEQRLAANVAVAAPRARVTLLARRVHGTDLGRLGSAGVEVVASEDPIPWLVHRTGHYSLVVCARDESRLELRPTVRATQPQARLVNPTGLESVSLKELLSRWGIACY